MAQEAKVRFLAEALARDLAVARPMAFRGAFQTGAATLAFAGLLYTSVQGGCCWAVTGYHSTLLLANAGLCVFCLVGSKMPLMDTPSFPFPLPAPLLDWPMAMYISDNYISQRSLNTFYAVSIANTLVSSFGIVAFFSGILPEEWGGTEGWQGGGSREAATWGMVASLCAWGATTVLPLLIALVVAGNNILGGQCGFMLSIVMNGVVASTATYYAAEEANRNADGCAMVHDALIVNAVASWMEFICVTMLGSLIKAASDPDHRCLFYILLHSTFVFCCLPALLFELMWLPYTAIVLGSSSCADTATSTSLVGVFSARCFLLVHNVALVAFLLTELDRFKKEEAEWWQGWFCCCPKPR